MEIARNRIRRDFAPLTVSVAIVCDSAYSPMMQVYNAYNGEYEPNRLLSPTVIRPIVTACASDGSWPTPSANESLANMKWYVNDVDITTLSDWSGLYSIDTVGSTRGSLTIKRNIAPGSNVTLRFEASLVDSRLGVTLPIRTEEVVLSTVDVAKDVCSMDVSEPNIRYNPFLDKLHLYEYKVAHGLTDASSAAETAAKDGNQYERAVRFNVYRAGQKLSSGFTVKLYRVNGVNDLTEISPSTDYEIVSLSTSVIVLDLRLIDKADYMVKAFEDTEEIARVQFAVNRIWADFTCRPTNETSILPDQTERYDEVQVDSEGKKVECPGNVIRITWYTDSATLTGVEHNEGAATVFQLSSTGVGKDYTNDWIDVYVDAHQKGVHYVALDEEGNELTDESGNILIWN